MNFLDKTLNILLIIALLLMPVTITYKIIDTLDTKCIKEEVLLEVTDKDKDTYLVKSGNIFVSKSNYKIYFHNNKNYLKVNSKFFNEIKIGDKIIAYEIIEFSKRTGEVKKIKYELKEKK